MRDPGIGVPLLYRIGIDIDARRNLAQHSGALGRRVNVFGQVYMTRLGDGGKRSIELILKLPC